ncbi:acetyl-CoA hydrolase/transferase C-terminal domain-containing protein [Sphingomonas sp. RB1R13]|uniref:acetyl-CoA hydrolase/transferase C-terminal domain-containing protein n=1 Tax=Sphingomonas sp. RB1R13 TaxID=3096159 RepID=UPI002FC8CC2E
MRHAIWANTACAAKDLFPIQINPSALASVLPPHGLTLVSGCSAESIALADAVAGAGAALGPMTFCQIVVGGLNRRRWSAGPDSRLLTLFLTPELCAEPDGVEFLPVCYQDALAELSRRRPAAALFMCAPPDATGHCSFGTEVSFIADLWKQIPVRIAHINPAMPRTRGDAGIPFGQITAWFELAQPLLTRPAPLPNPTAKAIATHVAPFIRDGDTLQTGLGKIPDAICGALATRKQLKVHTGLLGDALMTLIASGAVCKAVAGTAIGTQALYDQLDHPALEFWPVSVTHNPRRLAALDRLVTINSAIEVDLFGQAYAEMTEEGFMSGPGGASDFARGARGGGGIRIVALPATSHGRSRVVPVGQGRGPVSLSRFDIDVVVTEYGAADLRGLDYATRAARLIAIACPSNRDWLTNAWAKYTATAR